jgi:CRP/FNR family transcriptional regulator, cyclic AMP receptor protein
VLTFTNREEQTMSPDPAIVEALGSTDLFRSLDKRALNRVANATKTVHHEVGKALTTEGRSGIAFHLILDGTATVTVGDRPGRQLGKGDYFGEISMIDGKARSATVTIDTPLTTAAITAWDFRPLLDEEPTMTKALLLAMCERLRSSERASA